MSLELQKFLRNGNGVDLLKLKYGINAKKHSVYSNLVLFKYNQIDSPMGERIVQEARGIILDSENDWAVVARGFDKFFNAEEGHAAKIDWSTARVQEKVDGSLMMLYHYKGEWHVASSGTPDASGPVNNGERTFRDLFWDTWNKLNYAEALKSVTKDTTLIFELTTPLNRVIVPHTDYKLTLIGIRNRESGIESPVSTAIGFNVVGEYPLKSLADIRLAFEKVDGLRQEGFVVVDGDFNRVKVKHPAYVAMHHLKDGMSDKRLLDIIRNGESAEFLAYFPEYAEQYNSLATKYSSLVKEISDIYETVKDIPVQKDFAIQVKDRRANSVYFLLRRGKGSVTSILKDVALDTLTDWLG